MTYTEFFREGQNDPTLFGGKGSNLIKLVKFGVNVPPGFVIDTKAYRKFLNESHLKEEIYQLLSSDYKPKNVLQLAAKIENLFLRTYISQEIIDDVRIAYNKMCERPDKDISFSVRSSANIEDSKSFSFAGQAKSFLNIKTFEEILISIRNCWISMYSPQALLYLLQMKKTHNLLSLCDLEMAVIIQQMVSSEVSGVLFTANILNNDWNQMLINSNWGLGESIANNLVIPDLIILNKENFNIIKNKIGKKEKKSIPNPRGISTILIETEQEFREKCSLNESQIHQLYNLGLQLERALDYPQDIEWAIENDVLYTIQSRDITTLRK